MLDEAKDLRVKGVLITHTHPDHVAGYADLKRLSDLPVWVHEGDADRLPGKPENLLLDNQEHSIGLHRFRIVHTPGHTPDGVCLVLDGALISGDTLFPGGPGRTRSADDFRRIVASITSRLYGLPEGTLVLPGHGADTTIGDSKREYEAFASRPHPAELHDHVSWLTS